MKLKTKMELSLMEIDLGMEKDPETLIRKVVKKAIKMEIKKANKVIRTVQTSKANGPI